MTQMRGHETAHDAPGLFAMFLHVDHSAEGRDKHGEGLFGHVTVTHDGEEAL